MPVILDLRPFGDREAKIGENLGKFIQHLTDRMNCSDPCLRCGQGEVDRLARQLRFERFGFEHGPPCLDRIGDFTAHRLDCGRGLRALLGVHRAQRLQLEADPAFLSERCNALFLERIERQCGGDGSQRCLLAGIKVGHR